MKLKDWDQKTASFKTLIAIKLLLSVAVIVLALLQLCNVWDKAINIFEPLLGIVMLIQTIETWKTNKLIAYASLFAAIFIFIMAIVVLI